MGVVWSPELRKAIRVMKRSENAHVQRMKAFNLSEVEKRSVSQVFNQSKQNNTAQTELWL